MHLDGMDCRMPSFLDCTRPHAIEGLLKHPLAAAAIEAVLFNPAARVEAMTRTWYEDDHIKLGGMVMLIKEVKTCCTDLVKLVLTYLPHASVYARSRFLDEADVQARVVQMVPGCTPALTMVYVHPDGTQLEGRYPPEDPGVGLVWREV